MCFLPASLVFGPTEANFISIAPQPSGGPFLKLVEQGKVSGTKGT
jgi:hypothetical protein